MYLQATSTKLVAKQTLDTPVTREVVEVVLNKAAVGKAFKKEAGGVTTAIHEMGDEEKLQMKQKLESDIFKVREVSSITKLDVADCSVK